MRDPQHRRAIWALPVVVVVSVVVLTALGVSGSSIAQMGTSPDSDSSVIAGAPRAIRTDEWVVRTPLVIGQVERGFSVDAPVGVGVHDMAVLYDLPTTSWSTLFRPQLWAYYGLPVSNAFAFEWWAIAAILLLGAYAFVFVLVRDWRWATVGALVLYASPFWHWWYLPGVLATTGWMLAGGAGLLASFASRGRRRWATAGAAGFAFTCAAFLFYPPFQIVLGFVVAAVVAGAVIARVRSGPLAWRDIAVPLAVALLAPIVLFGLFVLEHLDVFRALADAAYPGRRVVAGGDGPSELLGSGWYGWAYVRDPDRMRGLVLANESEASSFLFVGLSAFLALPFLAGLGSSALRRWRWVLGTLGAVLVLLSLHLLVGLPSLVDRMTLLSRVPSRRVLIGLGVGSTIALVLIGIVLERTRMSMRRLALTALVVSVPVAIAAAVVGLRLRDAGAHLGTSGIVVTVLIAAVTSCVYVVRPLAGATVLAAMGLMLSLGANPLVRGIDPVRPGALVAAIHSAEGTAPGSVWLSSRVDVTVVLTADGSAVLSGVNLYPNSSAWRILDPTGTSEEIWNRYSNTLWVFDAAVDHPRFELLGDDLVRVTLAPCAPELDGLGVGLLVSDGPLVGGCVEPLGTAPAPRGGTVTLARRR